MKFPATLSIMLFTLTLGCSDESAFTGSAVNVPGSPVSTPPEIIVPSGDAVAESPVPDDMNPSPVEIENNTPPAEVVLVPEVPRPSLPNAQLVTKVGVNFEDQPGGDADYNDAVLCFKGNFEVTPSIIQATSEQTVEAVLFTEALCTNLILVEISRGDKVISSSTFNPKSSRNAKLKFAKGDRLHVSLVSTDCNAGQIFPMTDKAMAKLAPDVCNVQ